MPVITNTTNLRSLTGTIGEVSKFNPYFSIYFYLIFKKLTVLLTLSNYDSKLLFKKCFCFFSLLNLLKGKHRILAGGQYYEQHTRRFFQLRKNGMDNLSIIKEQPQ